MSDKSETIIHGGGESEAVNRRGFLGQAGGAAVGAGLLAACGAGGDESEAGSSAAVQTGPRVRWRLASSFPRGLDTIFGTAEHLAEMCSTLTGGRFEIRP